jgi:hypothetical protein
MAAIGREGGESRSAAARQARQRMPEREVPMSVSRDGHDRRPEPRPVERPRTDAPRADGMADGHASR